MAQAVIERLVPDVSSEVAVDETVLLDDGRTVHLRPIRPADAPALQVMHGKLSPRTVYQRFFTALPELSPAMAARFTEVDGVQRVAIVGEDAAGDLVAVGRYDRLPPDGAHAEVAVVIIDAYQQHGLGTRIVQQLVEVGRAHGVEAFVAEVLMANQGMFHAFADAGLTARASYDAGVAHLVMPLDVPTDAATDSVTVS